ncbi:MAG: glutathione S-transferase N-terminal domain-containing protein [Pseudomonadota bacterium]|nr:glutathione S-transferase N-terminal domain-containing protein [Pseudomonadota bacterium]
MIEFHASLTPNAQKIWIVLEELGLDYETRLVNVWKGDQFTDAFARLNPNRKVPVIVDGDGPGGEPYAVFESGAILIYLAEKHGRFLPAEGKARYETLKWLMVQMSGQGPMSGQFVHFNRYAPAGIDYAISRYTTECDRLYEVLDTRLGETSWLAGDEYTIADIATFPWIRTLSRNFADREGFHTRDNPRYPRLWNWMGRLAARPAVERALAIVDATPSTQANATDDDRDRFFQRGIYARA